MELRHLSTLFFRTTFSTAQTSLRVWMPLFSLKDSTQFYAEVVTKSAAQPEFQLFFTEDE